MSEKKSLKKKLFIIRMKLNEKHSLVYDPYGSNKAKLFHIELKDD